MAADSGDDRSGDVTNDLSGTFSGHVVQGRDISINLPAAHLPSPRQLPPPTRTFTNRGSELSTLSALIDTSHRPRAPTIAVVSGTGGVGKTALLLHWLHTSDEHFPDGQLYIDLHGFSDAEPVAPSTALARFLRAFGVDPQRVPTELDEQAMLFRSLTSGKRIVIMADNAVSAAQVRALLPGPGPSLVAVTSRRPIRGLVAEGAFYLDLAPLGPSAAVSLLEQLVGTDRIAGEPDAARSMAELCGRLPIALCAGAARLSARRRWSIERLVRELGDERRRLAVLSSSDDVTVRASLELSYAALPGDAALLYRRIGLLAGTDSGAGPAAAAADVDDQEARDSLDTLLDASLLEDVGEDRYRMHDLIRLHAREKAREIDGEQETGEAIRRVVEWYLAMAAAADVKTMPGRWRLGAHFAAAGRSHHFGSATDALDWLEAEMPNLMAVQRIAAEHGLHEQAWQTCEAMWALFLYRKHYPDWITTHERALASARTCGDTRAEAWVTDHLGIAYLHLGRLDDAEPLFRRALELERSTDHRIGEASALEHAAIVALDKGRTEEAIRGFTEARTIFAELGRRRGYAMLTRRIGEALRSIRREDEARERFTEAAQRFADLGDDYQEARALTGLAEMDVEAGHPRAATQRLERALAVMSALNARSELARIHRVFGDAFAALDLAGEARGHLEQALAIFAELQAPEEKEIRDRISALPRKPTGEGE